MKYPQESLLTRREHLHFLAQRFFVRVSMRSKIPTKFYSHKTAHVAVLVIINLNFALCMHPTHENRSVSNGLKVTGPPH